MRNRLIGVAVLAVAVIAVFVLLIDSPLKAGSVSAPDQANWLQDLSDESVDSYVYRYVPGADYYGLTTVRNGGMLPVTLLAATPEESDLAGPNTVEYRVAGRVGADGGVGFAAANESPRLESESLAPGEEIGLWIHWHMGACDPQGHLPYGPGSSAIMVQVLVNWSVMGVPRTSWVPLVHFFETRNVDTDSHDTCVGAPS